MAKRKKRKTKERKKYVRRESKVTNCSKCKKLISGQKGNICLMCIQECKTYNPTPEQILKECAEIQKTWQPSEEEYRRADDNARPIKPDYGKIVRLNIG